MIPELWRCPDCGKTWEIVCSAPGTGSQIGFCDFPCPTPNCDNRLLDDPAMNDESTLPGLIGSPIRYRQFGSPQWHSIV